MPQQRDKEGVQPMLYRKSKRRVTWAFRRPSAASHGSTTQTNREEREWFEKDAAFQSQMRYVSSRQVLEEEGEQ